MFYYIAPLSIETILYAAFDLCSRLSIIVYAPFIFAFSLLQHHDELAFFFLNNNYIQFYFWVILSMAPGGWGTCKWSVTTLRPPHTSPYQSIRIENVSCKICWSGFVRTCSGWVCSTINHNKLYSFTQYYLKIFVLTYKFWRRQ